MLETKKRYNCYITTFYTPNLFWFITDLEEDARKDLTAQLNSAARKTPFVAIRGNKREICLAQIDGDWMRVEIVTIIEIDCYLCWLIDFGYFSKVTDVYEIPKQFVFQEEFAHKATLNKLCPDNDEEKWDPRVRQYVAEYSSNREQMFELKYKQDDYFIGELFIKFNSKVIKLSDKLINLNYGEIDKNKFHSILYNSKMSTSLQKVYDDLYSKKTKELKKIKLDDAKKGKQSRNNNSSSDSKKKQEYDRKKKYNTTSVHIESPDYNDEPRKQKKSGFDEKKYKSKYKNSHKDYTSESNDSDDNYREDKYSKQKMLKDVPFRSKTKYTERNVSDDSSENSELDYIYRREKCRNYEEGDGDTSRNKKYREKSTSRKNKDEELFRRSNKSKKGYNSDDSSDNYNYKKDSDEMSRNKKYRATSKSRKKYDEQKQNENLHRRNNKSKMNDESDENNDFNYNCRRNKYPNYEKDEDDESLDRKYCAPSNPRKNKYEKENQDEDLPRRSNKSKKDEDSEENSDVDYYKQDKYLKNKNQRKSTEESKKATSCEEQEHFNQRRRRTASTSKKENHNKDSRRSSTKSKDFAENSDEDHNYRKSKKKHKKRSNATDKYDKDDNASDENSDVDCYHKEDKFLKSENQNKLNKKTTANEDSGNQKKLDKKIENEDKDKQLKLSYVTTVKIVKDSDDENFDKSNNDSDGNSKQDSSNDNKKEIKQAAEVKEKSSKCDEENQHHSSSQSKTLNDSEEKCNQNTDSHKISNKSKDDSTENSEDHSKSTKSSELSIAEEEKSPTSKKNECTENVNDKTKEIDKSAEDNDLDWWCREDSKNNQKKNLSSKKGSTSETEKNSVNKKNNSRGSTKSQVVKFENWQIENSEDESMPSANSRKDNDSTNKPNKRNTVKPPKGNDDDFDMYTVKPICNSPMIVNGNCTCLVCESWQDNAIVKMKPNEKKKVEKPPPFLKTSENSIEEIKTKKQFTNFTDELQSPKILIHGHFIPTPVEKLCDVDFNKSVITNLQNNGIDNPFSIQSYAWPGIMRGHNVFIIDNRTSGKTMSFVPPICTFILNENVDLPKCYGPIALIICPKVQVADTVYKYIDMTLGQRKQSVVFLAAPPFNWNEKHDVDILVCTVPALMKMLGNKSISLKRLCYLVFESASELLDLYPQEMETIINKAQHITLKRIFSHTIQLIVTSVEWTNELSNLGKRLNSLPLVCIGCYLEAAMYGRILLKILCTESQKKIAKTLDLLKNATHKGKTLIIANPEEDLEKLTNYLIVNGIDCAALNDYSKKDEIESVRHRWMNDSNFVIICTDDIVTDLAITNAFYIIQYTLPQSWSQFCFRFLPVIENYESPFIEQKNYNNCRMTVFIDESNMQIFSRVITFLKRIKTEISDHLLEKQSEILKSSEIMKIENRVRLCDKLFQLGKCSDIHSCKYRHTFSSELDISERFLQSGLIKAKISHFACPRSYYLRILEHTDSDGVTKTIENHFKLIEEKLEELTANDKSVGNVRIGNWFAIKDARGTMRRCEVIKIDKQRHPSTVVVRLIDVGLECSIDVTDLMKLPEILQNIPPQVILTHLANISPLTDNFWPNKSLKILMRECKNMDYNNPNIYFSGRIKLQLNNSLIVDDLSFSEVYENKYFNLHKTSLRKIMIRLQIAEENPDHLKNLYAICVNSNIDLPNYDLPPLKKENKTIQQIKPNYAHLEDGKEFHRVFFSSGYTPNLFYVRLADNKQSFKNLQNDIMDSINQPFLPEISEVILGGYYLMFDSEDQMYTRVKIVEIAGDVIKCFCVDFGDFQITNISKIKYLPNNLIKQLPFQAIECKLYGIKPANESWQEKATEIFYQNAFERGTDIYEFLHIKMIEWEAPEINNFKKYSVILVNAYENKIINKLLIDLKYALPIENQSIEIDLDQIQLNEEPEKGETNTTDDSRVLFTMGDLDGIVNSHDVILEEFLGMRENSVPESNETVIYNKKDEKPPVFLNYSLPDVLWRQNESTITLNIKLVGVVNYDLKLETDNILSFSTLLGDTNYKFSIELSAEIKKIIHKLFGTYILVKLEKLEHKVWDTLYVGEKLRHIKYDINDIISDVGNPTYQLISKKSKEYGKMLELHKDYVTTIGSDIDWDESDLDGNVSTDDSN